MATMDIFEGSAFTCLELTARFGKIPHLPQRLAQMGLFETDGVRTEDFAVERSNRGLSLIPYTDREAPAQNLNGSKRDLFKFSTGHWPLQRTIRPTEIQNVRAFGSETELASVMGVVGEKVAEMRPYHLASLEYQRLNAIKGIIVDSDGTTVIENLFTRFSISQATLDFALDSSSTVVRAKCLDAKRTIETALGGMTYASIHALCGADFFDALIDHDNVAPAYANWSTNAQMRSDPRYSGFEFGGIFFEEYRGSVGGIDFIESDECHLFPLGVPGMFLSRFSPANMIEFANTPGLPLYVSQERLLHGRGIEILTESNPMSICTRPEATVKGTLT